MFLYIALIIFAIWLGLISFYLRRTMLHYQTLTKGVNKKTLEDVLTRMSRDLDIAKKDIDRLVSRCDTIEKRQQFHIQKIGLLRFNPFKDTGGDQSFILSLLDAKDTGVVITALYSRSGTRWYTKKVIKGKGVEHELSEEEGKAVKIANEESALM